MNNFLKGFIVYVAFWIIAIVLTIVLIDDMNIRLSVLLLEIVVATIGLFYGQAVFNGLRQQYTSERMLKSLKRIKTGNITYKDFEPSYSLHDFSLNLIDDVRIYHKLFDEVVKPSKVKPVMISHVWLDKEVPVELIVKYHQEYALNEYQGLKIRASVLVTFLESEEDLINFRQTLIYDNVNRLSYYHIPVLVQDKYCYLYDTEDYSLNRELKAFIEHLNESIKDKKLEF